MIARLAAGRLIGPVALACAAPLAAQAASPYDEAVAARQAGDAARAEALLAPWVAAHPDDVDARLQLAYARLALGRLDAAEADFRRVLSAAPGYADARGGLDLIIARRMGRSERAALFVEGALSDISSQARDWTEVAAGAVVPIGARTMLDLRGARHRRFGVGDTEVEVGATIHPVPDLWLRLGASRTPRADFRPRWGIRAGIDKRFSDAAGATVIGLDVHHRTFPAQDVFTIEPHVTRYFADGRTSATVRGSGTFAQGSGVEPGILVRADHAPRERLRLFAGAAIGADTELGVVTSTGTAFVGGEVPLGAKLSLTVAAAREWRGDGIDRTEGRVGLKIGL